MRVCAMIMAGGQGTRFWPWSSALLPKQFLPIAHPDHSLLQQTVERILPLVGYDHLLVLTNQEYVALVRTQLPQLSPDQIVGEPMVRDTAAAIGLGSALAAERWPDAVQVVLPADHAIEPADRFRQVVAYAASCAHADGHLYTIGIPPTRPTPVYGYLRLGEALRAAPGHARHDVAAFVEKPDAVTAERYVVSGDHLWNAGMFIWRPEAVHEALSRRLPLHARLLAEVVARRHQPDFMDRLREVFVRLPRISIDFGMMQAEGEAGAVRTVAGDFEWSDLGGWEAFADRVPADTGRNRVYGRAHHWERDRWAECCHPREPRISDKDESLSVGDVYTMDSSDNLVFNDHYGHRVALYGVRDLAVIHTRRATLVTPRDRAEAIKPLVAALPGPEHRGGVVEPHKVVKPWGWELWWGWTDGFAGKTLFLQQGKRLSLQYHVVKEEVIFVHEGRVKLQSAARGEPLEEVVLEAGQGVHVEPGRLHRFEAVVDSILLESSLPLLWDVVRVADDFGREGTRAAEAPPTTETDE